MKKVYWFLIIAIFIIAITTAIILINYAINKPVDQGPLSNSQLDCLQLNCPSGSIYVGSINSDKYYSCNCSYAQRILPENIICFASDSEALAEGYTKIDC